MQKLLPILAIMLITGCATKTSPERHAYYYARHDPSLVGGSYQRNPMAVAKLNLPTYLQVYKQGQAARASNMTPEQAQQVSEAIYHSAVANTTTRETYMGMKARDREDAMDRDAAHLWGKTLQDTFMDGYHGVK